MVTNQKKEGKHGTRQQSPKEKTRVVRCQLTRKAGESVQMPDPAPKICGEGAISILAETIKSGRKRSRGKLVANKYKLFLSLVNLPIIKLNMHSYTQKFLLVTNLVASAATRSTALASLPWLISESSWTR